MTEDGAREHDEPQRVRHAAVPAPLGERPGEVQDDVDVGCHRERGAPHERGAAERFAVARLAVAGSQQAVGQGVHGHAF